MSRPVQKLTAQMENFIRMEARGESHAKILEEVFNLPPGSPEKEIHNADCKMSRWRKRPEYNTIWADELSVAVKRRIGGALSTIIAQMNDKNGWLANKAANDIVTLAKSVGLIHNEETALKVQIEGMPDLGSPDQEE